MKLSRIASLLAGIGILAGVQVAHASDGTITFTGGLTPNTCIINSGAPDFTVYMPTINTSALPSVGSTAGWTTFQIKLTGCTATGNVLAYFEPVGPTVDIAAGRLNNTGGAAGVQIVLRDAGASSDIFIGQVNTQTPTAITGGNATLTYLAGYYATTAAVTAGTVLSSVTYSISYP